MTALVLSLFAAAPPPWEQALLPPEPGRMEARAGALLNLVDASPAPGAVFSFRMTVSRRVSLGAPLFITLTLLESGPFMLAVSGGITNFLTGAAPFVAPVFTAHVEGYARGRTTAVRVRAGVTGRAPEGTFAAGAQAAVLQRLGERVSIGLELDAQWQLLPSRESATFAAGAWSWPKLGPTVRVWLAGDWSLDLIGLVGTGQPTLVAGAAIVWAPKILP
ncbi:MAG: hypothetical protein JNK82_40030 [Myxococcaceae bacterium]|nr:hypothetical protein [Myxococcaceae bacterium]